MAKLLWKTLVSLTLLAGVVVGLSIYYAGAEMSFQKPAARHDCPVYPYTKELFFSNSTEKIEDTWPTNDEEGVPATPGPGFIDREIFDRLQRDGKQPAALTSDGEFLRRIYQDLTGRIPTLEQAQEFLDDQRPNKRELLINSLLNRPEFAERMTYFFGELLRNTGRRLYGPGRNQFFRYIKRSVQDMVREDNPQPYTQFAREMITPSGENISSGPVNFLARAWELNSIQADFRDDVAIQVSRVFLGTPLLCISCHNGRGHLERINEGLKDKRRTDLWGMAGFFNLQWTNVRQNHTYRVEEVSLPGYRTTDGGGYRPLRNPGNPRQFPDFIAPKYIRFDTLDGSRDITISRDANFREEFVRLLFDDPLFAKATVNYLWNEMMGRGIVDPPNAFDHARQNPNQLPPDTQLQPSHPRLLSELADEFRASNYNIRRVVELIVKSNAYQLSARYTGQRPTPDYFAYRNLRRVTGEQLHDTIKIATGVLNAPDYDTGLGYRETLAVRMQEPGIIGTNAGNILGIFESGDRDEVERARRGSIRQTMFLLNNSDFIAPRLKYTNNNGNLIRRLLDMRVPLEGEPDQQRPLTNAEIVDGLFIATLSRHPNDDEMTKAVAQLNTDRTKGAENVQYALINMMEFLFN